MYGGPVGIEKGIPGEYLIDALFEVGPTQIRDGEEGPVSWSELSAYGQAVQAISEPWEFRAIMNMSKAYLRAKREGKDVHCIAPVDREDDA